MITDQVGKGIPPIGADFLGVKRLEVAVMRLMEGNLNRHHLAQAQLSSALSRC
jgi:hypothetical protein